VPSSLRPDLLRRRAQIARVLVRNAGRDLVRSSDLHQARPVARHPRRPASEQPLAAASLGQVHRAVLRDGREAAVKVQRPGIREVVARDLEVLHEVASFLDDHTEAGERYQARFDRLVVPEPVTGLTTSRC
jgi:predicted unusual protein kinase regulating ubiquinone biosynthesis (AarF/ABC1/UbiB family)